MNTLSDRELIRSFAEKQSNAAFAELVHRHLGLVYASALRQVRSPDLASDVAQAVFLLLARKASTLPSKVVLSGWLFRSTRFVAARMMRDEDLRHRREQEAAEMNLHASHPENELWTAVEPHLDDAVAALGEKDRQAVLLRFFEGKRIREVGELLGLGEDAAKKRITRALEKLRTALGRRGVAVPALTLVGVLAGAQAQAAPASLVQVIGATTATTAAKASLATLVAGAARDWLWLKARAGLALAGSAAAIVVLSSTLWAAGRDPAVPSASAAIVATPTQNSEFKTQNSKFSSSPLPIRPAPAVTPTTTGRRILLNVRDKASDAPIAGARVLPCILARGRENFVDESFTGPDGTSEFTLPDLAPATLLIWLSASNHVPMEIAWNANELREDTLLYTAHLERGTQLHGRVVDEEGQPIGGVQVRFEAWGNDRNQREHIGFADKLSSQITGTDGRFASDQMPTDFLGLNLRIHFLNTNYASAMDTLHTAAELATNRTVMLLRGMPVRGQVVNLQGNPIGGAKLQEGEFDNSENNVTVRTAPDGSFEIPHATREPRYWTASAKGYTEQMLAVVGTTDAPPLTVTMQGKKKKTNVIQTFRARVVGTVMDADTGEPVSKFKVMAGYGRTEPQFYADGVNGGFDLKMGIINPPEGYYFQVEAEGYMPEPSEHRTDTNDVQRYEFRLHRGTELTGVVLQPDGQPAAGAIVGINSAQAPIAPMVQEDTQIAEISRSDAQTRADTAGRFVLPPQRGKILISHPSGFLVAPGAIATNVNFTLQPWGRIEGTFMIGPKPTAQQEIFLVRSTTNSDFGIYRPTATDTRGHFLFTNVPPGDFIIIHLINTNPRGRGAFDRRTLVAVKPGETAQVTLGGQGRAVTGKLELAQTIPGYEWGSDLQALVVPVPNLPEPEAKNFTSLRDYQLAQSKWLSQVTRYFLVIQPDGTFRADDVPPGNYELWLKITKAPLSFDPTEPGGTEGIRIGGTSLNVNIPAANPGEDKPVHLGTITVPINPDSKP